MTKLTEERIKELWHAHLEQWPEINKTLISPVMFARLIEAELQPEPVTRRSSQPSVVALLPNGATASNVYEAYEEGRKSVHPVQSPDKGPWVAGKCDDGRVYLQSDDFTHDVRLYVDGDFAGNISDYAEQLAAWMNSKASQAQPVQEPVSFYIYKETAPRLNLTNVMVDALPWVYDQDPSSGFAARLKVYIAPPDQTAEIARLREELEKADSTIIQACITDKELRERIATLEAALRSARYTM